MELYFSICLLIILFTSCAVGKINITGFNKERLRGNEENRTVIYKEYTFESGEHLNLTCISEDNTLKPSWDVEDKKCSVVFKNIFRENKSLKINGSISLNDNCVGKTITCIATEDPEYVESNPQAYKYIVKLLKENKATSTETSTGHNNNFDVLTPSNQKPDNEDITFIIVIVVGVIIILVISSASILYKCHRKRKPHPISTTNDHILNNDYVEIRHNPAYDQCAARTSPENDLYEPCYDEIGRVSDNTSRVSYATVQFGNELYAKPTPKASRQNKKNPIYAEVLSKAERDNPTGINNDVADANEAVGYYNVFDNQRYMNSRTNQEYAEPCYVESSTK